MDKKTTVGSRVARKDPGYYTDQRKGTVIEINADETKVRVEWDENPDGTALKPIKTWVPAKGITVITYAEPKPEAEGVTEDQAKTEAPAPEKTEAPEVKETAAAKKARLKAEKLAAKKQPEPSQQG